ncbi:MAG: DNA phosphorothioation-dependent restriction protein DptG [Fusobacteriaceae bacterium]
MRLKLNDIKEQFKYSESKKDGDFKISHVKPKIANFIPYDTKIKKIHMKDFLGHFGRGIIEKKISTKDSDNKDVLQRILNSLTGIPTGKENYFRQFFTELFFKDKELQFVHPKLLFFLNLNERNDTEIPLFLKDVFIDEELQQKFIKIYDFNNNELDILTDMLIQSLNKLENHKSTKTYHDKVPYITEYFKKDLLCLLDNEKFFIEDFENLMVFYYFMYISLLSLELNIQKRRETETEKGFVFIFKWEKASKQRENYIKGWNKFEKVTEQLFTHRNLLEMLNHNTLNEQNPSIYSEIFEKISSLTETEKSNYNSDLLQLRAWYRNSLEYKAQNPNTKEGSTIETNIDFLFEEIEYQFKNTARKKPYTDHVKNITEFTKYYFTKRGGSLGTILSLNETYTLLLTKLCIGKNKEIRLNELYKEFEKRGVLLDKYSKEELKEYYEKLNILDKKSDSGDAIYVKYIL